LHGGWYFYLWSCFSQLLLRLGGNRVLSLEIIGQQVSFCTCDRYCKVDLFRHDTLITFDIVERRQSFAGQPCDTEVIDEPDMCFRDMVFLIV